MKVISRPYTPKEPDCPPQYGQTPRRRILALLQGAEAPLSALDISALAGVTEKEARLHLEHIRRSLRQEGIRLRVIAPVCQKCGFSFTRRDRLTRPGKCPLCKATRASEPLFSL